MGRCLTLAIRVCLALAFLVAGVIKLSRPEVFAVTIRAFGILPGGLVEPVSVALPVVEVAAALMLLLGVRGGLTLTAGMLVLFVAILAYALNMGLDIDCGCYGPSDPEREAFGSIRQSLWRDGAMLAGVLWLYAAGFMRRAKAGKQVPGI